MYYTNIAKINPFIIILLFTTLFALWYVCWNRRNYGKTFKSPLLLLSCLYINMNIIF